MTTEFEQRTPAVLCAYQVASIEGWFTTQPDEFTVLEAMLLGEATHFGVRVPWGLVDEPDPCGNVWPSTVLRPIMPGFQAIHAGEC
jgi:hypothetical protein